MKTIQKDFCSTVLTYTFLEDELSFKNIFNERDEILDKLLIVSA